jgi:HSP20 family protein
MDTKNLVRVEPSPFPLLTQLGRDLDWLFDRFGFEGLKSFGPTPGAFKPDVEILDRGGEFIVRVEVPGLKRENITLEITDEELLIRGERKQEKEEKSEGFYRSEFSYGEFARAVPLPDGVAIDKAKAQVRDGVLEIKMPIARIEQKRRRLEIQEPPTGEKKHAA